jgi:hypothetical protein
VAVIWSLLLSTLFWRLTTVHSARS